MKVAGHGLSTHKVSSTKKKKERKEKERSDSCQIDNECPESYLQPQYSSTKEAEIGDCKCGASLGYRDPVSIKLIPPKPSH